MISAVFKADNPDLPNGDIMRDWFMLPSPKDEENDRERGVPVGTARDNKIRKIKRMLYAFGLPFTPDGFDAEDLVGETTKMKCFVRQEARLDKTTKKETGQMDNRISWPRFKGDTGDGDENGKGRKPAARRR